MITTYMKNKLLNDWFRNEAYDFPDIIYLGLSKTSPNEDGTGVTEPTANSYKRLALNCDTDTWTTSTEGSVTNVNVLRFSESEECWASSQDPITHYVIYDNDNNGNLLFYGELERVQEIPIGSILEVKDRVLTTTIIN